MQNENPKNKLPAEAGNEPPAENGAVKEATPRLYEIRPVTVELTAQGILARGAELASQWNALAAKASDKRAEIAKLHDELASLEGGYRGIRLQMRSLYDTCKANELPMSEEIRQVCEDRDDRGNNIAPPPPPDAQKS